MSVDNFYYKHTGSGYIPQDRVPAKLRALFEYCTAWEKEPEAEEIRKVFLGEEGYVDEKIYDFIAGKRAFTFDLLAELFRFFFTDHLLYSTGVMETLSLIHENLVYEGDTIVFFIIKEYGNLGKFIFSRESEPIHCLHDPDLFDELFQKYEEELTGGGLFSYQEVADRVINELPEEDWECYSLSEIIKSNVGAKNSLF